jgi:vacuolar-type H+-ATPase subunit H
MTSTSEIPQRYEAKSSSVSDILLIETNVLYFSNSDEAQKAVDPLNKRIQDIYKEKTGMTRKITEFFTGKPVESWEEFFNTITKKTTDKCNEIAEKAQGDISQIQTDLSTTIVDNLVNGELMKTRSPNSASAKGQINEIT